MRVHGLGLYIDLDGSHQNDSESPEDEEEAILTLIYGRLIFPRYLLSDHFLRTTLACSLAPVPPEGSIIPMAAASVSYRRKHYNCIGLLIGPINRPIFTGKFS